MPVLIRVREEEEMALFRVEVVPELRPMEEERPEPRPLFKLWDLSEVELDDE